jgi:hypothetical protein
LLPYDIPLKRKYLVCTLVPISQLAKNFSMKTNHILSFTFFTFNIVWENLKGVGPKFPPVHYAHRTKVLGFLLNLLPLLDGSDVYVLSQDPFPSGDWTVPTWSAWVVANWGAVSNGGWTGSIKLATSWGWFWNSHFFTNPSQHLFPAASITN